VGVLAKAVIGVGKHHLHAFLWASQKSELGFLHEVLSPMC
jgi:hypothetical protein